MKTEKIAVLTLAACCLALPLAARADAEEAVLNVYNWSEYIGDDTIALFEKETGIKVRLDTFDSNEILHAKLVAGRSGYDIVIPSSTWAKLQIDGGLLRKLDKSQLPNLKHLDPALQAELAKADPGNQHMVSWLWGYTAVGINVEKVKAALGSLPMPENAWDLVFKPEYMSKLKSCGVSFLDSPSEIMPVALQYLGKPPDSRNPADYTQATQMLKAVRPHIALFSSSGGYLNDLAKGALCASIGWSGDFGNARQRSKQAGLNYNIQTLIPKSGSLLFFDGMVIPADAPHPSNAHKFINFILRPEIHAGLSNKLYYANANLASRKFVRPEVAQDTTVFLGPADLAKMVAPEPLNNDLRRLMARSFTSFKTGI
ncbi:polyamine ABC transporter substrate-binding protein [Paucibacter soli]|uniref:polyamine ABC transporter substrate-binding protein n=1 Tax=Paucibacter soli TaxID=3133433 RepID=UPI0030A98563